MYEIWLVINILWEIALSLWPVLLMLGLAWAALVLRALGRDGQWRRTVGLAVAIGAVVTLVLIPVVPSAVDSSLSDMGYWVDWANLLAICGGLGAVVTAFAWPVLASRTARP